MDLNISFSLLFLYTNLVILSLMTLCGAAQNQMVPAIYVFGDSLVDVGNNNHLKLSLAKANFPHNGIDFPNKKATGRFSNGKNAADFLAEKVGLPTSPPYLYVRNKNASSFLSGVSFASGGAKIIDDTDKPYVDDRAFFNILIIHLVKQVDYYSIVNKQLVQQLGATSSQKHFSKSLFSIVIGSNDIFGYFGSSEKRKTSTPQQFVDLMAHTLKAQLKRLYELGGRKFVVVELGLIGCCPAQRNKNNTQCNEQVNFWAHKYNQALKTMMVKFKSELKDINYSLFDTYTLIHNFMKKPAAYGFKEIKVACCGLGNLNAKVACLPISQYCHNRRDHIFWDLYHPTEAASSISIDYLFYGSSNFTFPMNVKQLIAV